MAAEEKAAGVVEETEGAAAIEQGTYEIIRDRLVQQARGLGEKAQALNAERIKVFGGTQMAIIGNERIRTENNCVPRDIVEVGDRLLFGYNAFLGLKKETDVSDVLSLRSFEQTDDGFKLEAVDASFLAAPKFISEFSELYRFYKDTELMQLRRVGQKLLAVFRTGATVSDIRVFQWAVSPDGSEVTYIDNRGEREQVFPPSHDFEWVPTTREQHVPGRHPHISIDDEVFIETVGGDLTIKVEDNTEDGLGVYREPVEDPDQSLDDAEILYARVGVLVLFKVLPYREEHYRYLLFNTRTKRAERIDAIGQACVQLPEDHGVIFPGGYHLQSGETKTFEGSTESLEFMRMIRSPNGEDVLYIFHSRMEGRSVLLPYNMIRKELQNPIRCNGFGLFPDGKLVVFRTESDEPTRVHPMQIWQTPFTSDEFAARAPSSGSYLEKIGNADLVRGISDMLSIRRAVEEQRPTVQIYEDLVAAVSRVLDDHYWLDRDEVGNLRKPLEEIKDTASLIVDEFQKVEEVRRQSGQAVDRAEKQLAELLRDLKPDSWTTSDAFVEGLAALRKQRGQLITLRNLRHVDVARVDGLEARVVEQFEKLTGHTVRFLLGEDALAPYHEKIAELVSSSEAIEKVAEAEPLRQRVETMNEQLQMLTEVVGGLKLEDSTQRTQILEGISEVLGSLNRCRALLENRRKELLSTEAVAEFGAEFNVFSQNVTSALGLADTPAKCDSELSRLMMALEELESRYAEFDQFIEDLSTKREEVYKAFSTKKQQLLDARQRRAGNMMQAAERILQTVSRRAATFADVDELNSYFASDPMVTKLKDLSSDLRELGDSVKADEVEARLKGAIQDAARGLRDREDIFTDGGDSIKLGRHSFSVNTQPLDLTMVPRDGEMYLHLTGTDFYQRIDDPEFAQTRDLWDQQLVSETADVYRGEYLAAKILADAELERGNHSLAQLRAAAATETDLLEIVRQYAGEAYDEGYERGLHDADAALILGKLLTLYQSAGLLRFSSSSRAAANLFWAHYEDRERAERWTRRARSLARLRDTFAPSAAHAELYGELSEAISAFFQAESIHLDPEEARFAGQYLAEELASDPVELVISAEAEQLRKDFMKHLRKTKNDRGFTDDLRLLADSVEERFELAEAWLGAFVDVASDEAVRANRHAVREAVMLILTESKVQRSVSHALTSADVEGLLGQHPRIVNRTLHLRLDEFMTRLGTFRRERVVAFQRFRELRHDLLEREREALRISEYMPKVMSSFVRNKLISEVYLPLIGDNLAKQIGALGKNKRTDLMGMLLLISPPGYGKTTLMEYIANRLGLVFMKINGPALGHQVLSLDPSEAPNATARQEVEKINLAFEMGNNVLLYIDDIQHTSSELLQKFISLCDAQRRIEGVWKGKTRTYDFRGKKFAVCMAGNPYTESGEKFQIPDMLANRADTYNLGDILEGREEAFALSYMENALTSNPVLSPLTTRDPEDLYKLVRMAAGEEVQADQLSHPYSSVELKDVLSVLEKLQRVQRVLLSVNQQYIYSAAQDDAYRTEPRFQLQGSYRNMNKLAEKILPVMNDSELESLLDDHYQGEAQSLTTGAEQNLLKLAELRNRMTEEQAARWEEIKEGFRRQRSMGGAEDDPVTRVTGTLGLVSEKLGDISQRIQDASRAVEADREKTAESNQIQALLLEKLEESLSGRRAPSAGSEGESRRPAADTEAVGQVTEQLAALSQGVQAMVAAMERYAQAGRGGGSSAGAVSPPPAAGPMRPHAPPQAPGAAPASPAAAAGRSQLASKSLEPELAGHPSPPGGKHSFSLPATIRSQLRSLSPSMDIRVVDALRTIDRRLKKAGVVDPAVDAMIEQALGELNQLRELLDALKGLDTQ